MLKIKINVKENKLKIIGLSLIGINRTIVPKHRLNKPFLEDVNSIPAIIKIISTKLIIFFTLEFLLLKNDA